MSICGMRKKYIFLGLILITKITVSLAQSSISGQLIDSSDGSALGFASIALYESADSSLVTGSISSEDGQFVLEKVKPGNYYLQAQFMGYAPKSVENIELERKEDIDLGQITLSPNDKMLEAIEVTGEKATNINKVDRQVFDSQSFQSSQGGTATDVLKNLPSITVF